MNNSDFFNFSVKFSGVVASYFLVSVGLSAPTNAATLTVIFDQSTNLSPTSLPIPIAGFGTTGNNSFTLSVKAKNENAFDVRVNKITFDLFEEDDKIPDEDGNNDPLRSFESTQDRVVAAGTTDTFVINFDVSNNLLRLNTARDEALDRVLGTDQLEFFSTNIVVQGPAVPEPLTLLGAGTALGFGAFFKRELSKRQKKEKTEV